MLISKVIDEQQIILKRRRVPPDIFPGTLLRWAIEVEKTHTDRLLALLKSICDESVVIVPVRESTTGSIPEKNVRTSNSILKNIPSLPCSSLIYSSINLVIDTSLPAEAFRSVHRMFFVPHSCSDPIQILNDPIFLELFNTSLSVKDVINVDKVDGYQTTHSQSKCVQNVTSKNVILKIQTSPKELEIYLSKMIHSKIVEVSQNSAMESHRRIFLLQSRHEKSKDIDRNTDHLVNEYNERMKNDNKAISNVIELDIINRKNKINSDSDYGYNYKNNGHNDDNKGNNDSNDNRNDNRDDDSNSIHEDFTHLLQCIYGVDDGIFRWGLVSKEESVRYNLLSIFLDSDIKNERLKRVQRDTRLYEENNNIINGVNEDIHNNSNDDNNNNNESKNNIVDYDNNANNNSNNSNDNSSNYDNNDNHSNDNNNNDENNDENDSVVEISGKFFRIVENKNVNIQGLGQPQNPKNPRNPEEKIRIIFDENRPEKKIEKLTVDQNGSENQNENKIENKDERENKNENGNKNNKNLFSPVSRAYYKMSEIKEFYFPLWGWIWPGCEILDKNTTKEDKNIVTHSLCTNSSVIINTPHTTMQHAVINKRKRIRCNAVDVGASPGGWTQCLAVHCAKVISIDPGQLAASVLSLRNVQHVSCLVQSQEAQTALKSVAKRTVSNPSKNLRNLADNREIISSSDCIDNSSGLRIAVCDTNIGSIEAATLLSTFVLPHMSNACRCYCNGIDDNNDNNNNDDNDNNNDNNSNNKNNNGDNNSNNNNNKSNIKNINNNNYNNNNNNNNNYNNNNCSNFCGGYIVLTLKLVKNAKENYIQNAIKGASRILSDSGCFDFHIIHLGANSKNERTLVCRFNGIK